MTQIIEIPQKESIAPLAGRMHAMIADADSCVVVDKASAVYATDISKAFRGFIKSLEDKRKELKAPILEAGRRIDDMFKPYTTEVLKTQKRLDAKLLEWTKKENARLEAEAAEKARGRLEAAAAQAAQLEKEGLAQQAEEVLDDALKPRVSEEHVKGRTRGELGGVATTVKRWAYELEDITLVPAEFLMIDEQKVKRAIADGVRKVSGLRIYEKEHLMVR